MSQPSEQGGHLFSDPELLAYATERLGLSPDIEIVPLEEWLAATVSTLSEEGTNLSIPADEDTMRHRHNQLMLEGRLPTHLQSFESFTQRYDELIGPVDNEVTDAMIRLREQSPSYDDQRFEQTAAYFIAGLLRPHLLDERSEFAQTFMRGAFRLNGDGQLTSRDGLEVQLPKRHDGIAWCAPSMADSAALSLYVKRNHLKNVALFSSTVFNEAFSVAMAQEVFTVSLEHVLTSHDILKGVVRLAIVNELRQDKGHRYGAVVMPLAHHLPERTVRGTIHAAPALMVPGGSLVLSGLHEHLGFSNSIEFMLRQAQRVFGRGPDMVVPMTDDEDRVLGQQAVFRYRGSPFPTLN